MPPKRTKGSTTLKPRTSKSRITKSSASSSSTKATPRTYTPRKTKSRSSIKSTENIPSRSSSTNTRQAGGTSSRPMRTRQKKKVSTSGTFISTLRESPEPSQSPSPSPPDHHHTTRQNVGSAEEATWFYGLDIFRSVTQHAREFLSGLGYGFGNSGNSASENKSTGKKKVGRKRGPRKK
ncbi:hypothetical protein TWF706_003881 [Orbilia oligospora]|uniref:Uncharacterized protein n=1 Tax=Orbilia oligospora TaxID=2813651 RepID=A0A7C8NP14_ORBOL|nr:hypothetical protein TWF706_003881 [Orbilia oligospora]KAF3142428.1 hypothetical protein TWF703_000817 [Orbilia oligospora]